MDDDINKEDINKEENEITNKDRFYFVLSYIPLINIALLFLDLPKITNLQRYINQWVVLFLLYILLFILWLVFGLWFLFTFLYIIFTLFLRVKAYNWEYVEIEFLERIISNFKSKK